MAVSTPGTNKTTTHYYQTQSRLQYCSTRQEDHYSSIYNFKQEHHNICTDQINGDRVLQSNSIIHQATSNHIRQQQSRTGTDGHRSNMVQQRKMKEGQAQGKGYGNYGNSYSHNNYKGGKGKYNQQPVGQGNPFKGQHGYGKGKGYSNKKKAKDTTTTNKEEKELKETSNKCLLQMWTNNAEWRSTTVTQQLLTPMTRQRTGTIRHTTTTTGIIRISHRCTNWRYHNHHR